METLQELFEKCPEAEKLFSDFGIETAGGAYTIDQALTTATDRQLRDIGATKETMAELVKALLEERKAMEKEAEDAGTFDDLESITIFGGHDKDGLLETVPVTIKKGECVCICGKTGSGKSRLLEDIEYLAWGDSPSGRKLLINGKALSEKERFSLENRFCSYLSQSMNFVMELSCKDFLHQHAFSRGLSCGGDLIEKIMECANSLAGEPLKEEDMITALSGGQSRALMIADIAWLSEAPVVLIDEPENAGIDKDAILKILGEREKMVLISTHDPVTALSCQKRIIIENGGIRKILERTKEEQVLLEELKEQDARLKQIRALIRGGENAA